MRKIYLLLLLIFVIFSCSTPSHFMVTGLGYEPTEQTSSVIYNLPRTGIKVHVDYQKEVFIPGPYADYAQRLLGIEGVGRERTEKYRIVAAGINATTEPDPARYLTISGIEGTFDDAFLDLAEEKGLVIRGNYQFSTNISELSVGNEQEGVLFTDVTMEPNVEKTEHTIYKTLITDTSFVRVPVTTEQMERKTIEKKAEEAARLILEIRSDRYYLSAGLVDPLPADFDLKTALAGLDRLEEDYLSLFIGKSYTETFTKEYFLIPDGTLETEEQNLDRFTEAQGIDAMEGEWIKLMIYPEGNARSLRNLLPQEPEPELHNKFYYRIPEICEVVVNYAGTTLASRRISIFQSGALVSEKVPME